MPTRSTTKLKELIYNKLKNDASLVALLGGNTKIVHANPLRKIDSYPCLVYNIINEEDEPYNETIPTGIARSQVQIEIFSASTSASVIDPIEDRVYALLHNQKISNTNIRVYTCFRRNRIPIFEKDLDVYRIITIYEITSVNK